MKKERVDILLQEQGLARSRTHAQALIMAGQVCKGDQLILKASEKFEIGTEFRLKEGQHSKYVSRGGIKLENALKFLDLNVAGLTALDVGMSTGGFTDCLLQAGVEKVIGVDVGHNQVAWKLRNDSRVLVKEGINARDLPSDITEGLHVDLVVADVSFISLSLVLPSALKHLKDGGHVLALIKPQFEVERHQVGKGGIVSDPQLHEGVKQRFLNLCATMGLYSCQIFSSGLPGTDGNEEYFLFALKGPLK